VIDLCLRDCTTVRTIAHRASDPPLRYSKGVCREGVERRAMTGATDDLISTSHTRFLEDRDGKVHSRALTNQEVAARDGAMGEVIRPANRISDPAASFISSSSSRELLASLALFWRFFLSFLPSIVPVEREL